MPICICRSLSRCSIINITTKTHTSPVFLISNDNSEIKRKKIPTRDSKNRFFDILNDAITIEPIDNNKIIELPSSDNENFKGTYFLTYFRISVQKQFVDFFYYICQQKLIPKFTTKNIGYYNDIDAFLKECKQYEMQSNGSNKEFSLSKGKKNNIVPPNCGVLEKQEMWDRVLRIEWVMNYLQNGWIDPAITFIEIINEYPWRIEILNKPNIINSIHKINNLEITTKKDNIDYSDIQLSSTYLFPKLKKNILSTDTNDINSIYCFYTVQNK